MKNMKVAVTGWNFNPKEDLSHTILCFPEDTEILSVQVQHNKPTLWINYMAPSENFEIDTSKKFHFAICKCEYTKFEMDAHIYIGNVNIGNNRYAVFYN